MGRMHWIVAISALGSLALGGLALGSLAVGGSALAGGGAGGEIGSGLLSLRDNKEQVPAKSSMLPEPAQNKSNDPTTPTWQTFSNYGQSKN